MSRYLVDRIERTPDDRGAARTPRCASCSATATLEAVVVEDNAHRRAAQRSRRGRCSCSSAPSPTPAWLGDQVALDDSGFVLTGRGGRRAGTAEAGAPLLLETSRPGVFAAGDVRSGSIKRVASAVGEGSMAVRLVHEHLPTAAPAPSAPPLRPVRRGLVDVAPAPVLAGLEGLDDRVPDRRSACRRAWRFGEESQQPTCPQVRHSRRCTHGVPMRRHSSQPCGVRGTTGPDRGGVGADPGTDGHGSGPPARAATSRRRADRLPRRRLPAPSGLARHDQLAVLDVDVDRRPVRGCHPRPAPARSASRPRAG